MLHVLPDRDTTRCARPWMYRRRWHGRRGTRLPRSVSAVNARFPFRAVRRIDRGTDADGRTVYRFHVERWRLSFLLWYFAAYAKCERRRGLNPWAPRRIFVKVMGLFYSRGA
jgi:hypothetical protein